MNNFHESEHHDASSGELVPIATRPVILYPSHEATAIHVDAPRISEVLLASGFTEQEATSFAVVLYTKDLLPEKEYGTLGFYVRGGFTTTLQNGEPRHYPIAVATAIDDDLQEVSETIWHELGHARHDKVLGYNKKILSNDERAVKRTKQAGAVALAAGTVFEVGGIVLTATQAIDYNFYGAAAAATLMVAGNLAREMPRAFLYYTDKGERYARKYARKQRQNQIVHKRTP